MMQGDATVGAILDSLDRNQISENTLVIVSSDNGAANHVYAPLRGAKTTIWEGGHRVPFFARWKGTIKAESTCDNTVCLNDLMATCAGLLETKVPDNACEDSVSFLPALLGKTNGSLREATVHQSLGGDMAIRQGDWKLVFLKSGAKELYNLKEDLGETKNLAAEKADLVTNLSALLQQYIDKGRSTAGEPQLGSQGFPPAKGKAPKASATPE